MAQFPTTSVQLGQTSNDVKTLQQFLISQGYSIPAGPTGYFGTQTQSALSQWHQANGIAPSTPGFGTNWGPLSISAAQGRPVNQQQQTQQSNNQLPSGTNDTRDANGLLVNPAGALFDRNTGAPLSGKTDPAQPHTDAEYDAGAASNPIIATRINAGNTLQQIQDAAATGDLSSLKNEFGQPFSLQEQQDALAQGMEDNRLFYEAQQANDKADTERQLAQKQADYQDSLIKSGENFQADRANLNQDVVNKGVLFSGSNAQRQAKLQKSYERDHASNLASYGRDVGNTAQGYQYQYGNDAANGLSKYYNAPTNTFGLNSAKGDVGTGGLSSIYNPNQFNFQGTQNVARKAVANQRAASYLGNKGNKLLSTSYNNQF